MAMEYPVGLDEVYEDSDESEVLRDLQEKLRRYELIFQATNDVLYELNLESAKVAWNEALYSQYGYELSEPAHTLEWWTSHVHPDDAFMLENKISDMFEGNGNNWQYEYRFRRADGNYNYVRDRGLLLRDLTGKPTRIIGSLLDVTAQKQLDIAKDEFISLVSHQLRTPLTIIRVYGEMLTSGEFGNLSDEQSQWVRNMTESSVRLIDVVGGILNISRMDLGRIRFSTSPGDIAGQVRGSIREVMPIADGKHVSIHFTAPKSLPPVELDATIFGQIVHNLLTNAIRYTKPNKGQVNVRISKRKDGYVLSVKDNGIGIPKDAEERIFDRFYRAKNAVATEAQGSGLGLYLIKVMCDAFGGKVWFKSQRGKGTTFYVLIPKHGMAHQSK